MCTIDWAALAALINAALVFWLIRVTKQYVQINAGMLAATKEAVAASTRQAEVGQSSLQLLEEQHNNETRRRIGPLIAFIDDALLMLELWHAYGSSPEKYGGIIGASNEPFSEAETTEVAKAAATVSLPGHRSLVQAGESIDRLNSSIANAKGYFHHNPQHVWQHDAAATNEVRIELHARIEEARFHLTHAREDLVKFLPPEARRAAEAGP